MHLLAICSSDTFISEVVTPMLFTGIMLTIFVLSILYFASQFFKKQEYEGFVKIELSQVAITLFLFITIFGSTCLAAQISEGFAGGDPFEIGRSYLDFMTNKMGKNVVQELYVTLLTAQFFGSWSEKRGCDPWGIIIPTGPSFIVIERVADFLLLILSPVFGSLVVQMVILEAIRGLALPFVLPAGIVMRLFPPTREASSFLLATAMGFAIVFPFTYVMHDAIVREMIKDDPVIVAISKGQASNEDFEASLKEQGREELSIFLSENKKFSFSSKIFYPMRYLSYIMLQALFLPALSITLTIAFIKGAMKFLSQKLG